MADGHTNGRRAYQIDFPVLWYLVRGVQFLLAVFYLKATYLSLKTDSFALDLISTIGILLLIAFFLSGIATGSADSIGIHYRVYLRLKTVAWADVQEIQWVGSRLKILIKGGGKRKKILVFLLNPLKSVGAYWAHRLGADAAPPEILARIQALPIESPPSVASAPPYSKWILRLFLGVGILFVLVLLWRLFSVPTTVSH